MYHTADAWSISLCKNLDNRSVIYRSVYCTPALVSSDTLPALSRPHVRLLLDRRSRAAAIRLASDVGQVDVGLWLARAQSSLTPKLVRDVETASRGEATLSPVLSR